MSETDEERGRTMLDYLGANWIAVLALAVSLFVLWSEHLSGFDPSFSLSGRVEITKNLGLTRFPGHSVKVHCGRSNSGCGSCGQRRALSKRRWESRIDFHGRGSFHS